MPGLMVAAARRMAEAAEVAAARMALFMGTATCMAAMVGPRRKLADFRQVLRLQNRPGLVHRRPAILNLNDPWENSSS